MRLAMRRWSIKSLCFAAALGVGLSCDSPHEPNLEHGDLVLDVASEDVTPPALLGLSFSPTAVDVSDGPASVDVLLQATDDLSGVATVGVTFRSPRATSAGGLAFSSGGDGYTISIEIPRYAAVGSWQIVVALTDNVGNTAVVSGAVLESLGFPRFIEVSSDPSDQSHPVPASLMFSPAAIDVSAGPQSVVAEIGLTDDLSGVFVDPSINQVYTFILQSPSGQQVRLLNPQFEVIGNGTVNATVRAAFTVPPLSESGEWAVVQFAVADVAGNRRTFTRSSLDGLGLTARLTVASSLSDTDPPVLKGLEVTPRVINTALGPQAVHVALDLEDPLAGLSFDHTTFFNRLWFESPTGQIVPVVRTDFVLTSGTVNDGRWEATVTFPQFSEGGTWNIDFLRLEDAVHNLRHLNRTSIAALGLDPTLVVLRPSLEPDGTVDSAGGTVLDAAFGSRAAIIAPPGVVTEPTTIAIDVFESPLDVALPAGFEAAGTFFVNIQLTPNLSPYPAPGLTLVLPLPSPRPAGAAIDLHKLDEATGDPVPATDINGNPIIGFVNADMHSATFDGVTSFSTFAGLVAEAIEIAIAVKPADAEPKIDTRSRGLTPVAVISSPNFDARRVDASTVRFAGATAVRDAVEDVNGDSRPDIVLFFRTTALELGPETTEAALTGSTRDGVRVIGVAAVDVM